MAKTYIDLDSQAKLASATNQIIASNAIDNSKVAAGAAIDFSKLAALTSGSILVGNGSNVPTAAAVSGDITLSNAGVVAIASGVIVNADINASAAIAFSKLAALSSGNILVGDGSNVAASVAVSGDITLSNAGVAAIASGVIVNADVNASAAIDFSKLASLTAGSVLLGNGSNVATATALSGDVTVNSSGVTAIGSGVIVDADINASAAIALSKLAEAVIQADGGQAFTANQSMGGFKLTNLGTPTVDADAASKGYVDGVATGLDLKASVRVATTANITLSGTQTIDGVAVSAGERVLVKDQTAGAENGIYVVSAGAWTRATDADNSPAGEVTTGMFTFVEEGTANSSKGYVLVTSGTITLGTTALAFSQFSEAGQIASGAGLSFTGSTLNVGDAGKGIQVNADDLEFAASEVVSTGLAVGASSWLIKIADTAVTPGAYGSASAVGTFTVDQQGRLTAAGSTSIAIAESAVTGLVSDLAAKQLRSTLTTKGDLYAATASDTVTRLGVGTNGQVLTADSAEATGMKWASPASTSFATREVPTGLINGSNAAYTLANTPTAGSEEVYLNGVLQDVGAGNDYTISGATITFATAPATGSKLLVNYRY